VAASGHSGFPTREQQGGNGVTYFERRPNGAIHYDGCIANHGDHGCRKPAKNSLYGSSSVTVSPDDRSVYLASSAGITTFKRRPNGGLAYRGCIANQGHYGCREASNNSLRRSRDVAVTGDGGSLYVASSGAISAFARAPKGKLAYDGCIANRGNFGCQAPVHDSLRFPNDLALSRDGESVYVASGIGSITELERDPNGALAFGSCFANGGDRGCEAPLHDSLGAATGVAVSRDGRSAYVVARRGIVTRRGDSITLFDRETSAP
jgi:sugar lactone lactonase YvrE